MLGLAIFISLVIQRDNRILLWIGIAVLLVGAILLFSAGILVFCKKDLHI